MDQLRQVDLTRRVGKTLPSVLLIGGKVVLKAFEGETLRNLIKDLRTKFAEVKITKPSASRGSSSEFYLVCIGFSG